MSIRTLQRRPEEQKRKRWPAAALTLGILLCLGLTALLIPAERAEEAWPAPALAQRLERRTQAALDAVVEEYATVRKHYSIPAGSLPAEPYWRNFGESRDPEVILSVIEQASELLGEETVVGWTPETKLRPGTAVQYYYDETILALSWQELSNERICTWCEVKVADASQLRRKLAGDSYGYPIQLPASWLAGQDNAVCAFSGDFYAFRTAGIHVYNGSLCYVSGDTADTCFFDREGNMLIAHRYEINSWAQAAAYVRENNIEFSVAFGPSVLENGVIRIPEDYPWGENFETYARALLSQVGHLHYLFLCANCREEGFDRFTTRETVELMIDHGCTMAYALDGGQTAELVFRNRVANTPEFDNERQVSDVICFASALPKGGGT